MVLPKKIQPSMESCNAESERAKTAAANIKQDDDEEEQCFGHTMQLLTSAWVSTVFNTAVRLDVLEIIAKAGHGAQLSASEIASRMPTKNPDAPAVLDRMLSLLASHSVLTCSVVDDGDGCHERRYGLSPVAKYFVKHPHGAPLVPLLLVNNQDKVMMDLWYELDAAILEGGISAFERVHGAPLFKLAARDHRFSENLYKVMVNHTKFYMTKLLDLESYKGFENLKSLVDVGGALGHAIAAITSKYPKIKGINFDLPQVVQRAPSHPGVEHKGGDMFERVPEGDAIFLKWILHNWDDDHCLKLLKNCYKALPEHGKVIVVEAVVPVNPYNGDAGTRYTIEGDVLMMGLCDLSAKARSEAEFQALATKAGFKGIRFECRVLNLWVMEFYK